MVFNIMCDTPINLVGLRPTLEKVFCKDSVNIVNIITQEKNMNSLKKDKATTKINGEFPLCNGLYVVNQMKLLRFAPL